MCSIEYKYRIVIAEMHKKRTQIYFPTSLHNTKEFIKGQYLLTPLFQPCLSPDKSLQNCPSQPNITSISLYAPILILTDPKSQNSQVPKFFQSILYVLGKQFGGPWLSLSLLRLIPPWARWIKSTILFPFLFS